MASPLALCSLVLLSSALLAWAAGTGFDTTEGGGRATANAESVEASDDGYLEEDVIRSLPGAPAHSFKQYSGYVTVDEKHGRKLFYWFVEAASDADNKPLTLWLNGGPGCSSVAGGAMAELGPFFPSKDGRSLIYNKFSWNLESNIIFLESPAGVGFSYSDTLSDYTTGDDRTADDSRAFLLGWLAKFPKYKRRPFYISGESYAGHYIPDLASLLLKHQEEDKGLLDFRGFLLGNPWTVTNSDVRGTADFWWSHSLISTHTYRAFVKLCNPAEFWVAEDLGPCYHVLLDAAREIGHLNPYDIYVDVCTTGPQAETARLLSQLGLNPNRRRRTGGGSSAGSLKAPYDPCVDNEVETYLNQPAVQEALHVAKLPYRWTGCSEVVNYSVADGISSKWNTWNSLIASPINITVFSGDVDSVCPTIGTRNWIEGLEAQGHLELTKKWYPWYLNSQVGGYTEEYNGGKFKFVTVRNAGHMVPYMQPARALVLFQAFVRGLSMPKFKGGRVDGEEMEGLSVPLLRRS